MRPSGSLAEPEEDRPRALQRAHIRRRVEDRRLAPIRVVRPLVLWDDVGDTYVRAVLDWQDHHAIVGGWTGGTGH